MHRRKKIVLLILPLLLILLIIVVPPLFYSVSSDLSKSARVKANILLIEGWLPQADIELAFNEIKENNHDHVITTGIQISGYYQLSMNGYLIFYPKSKLKEADHKEEHIIEIDAYSELEGKDRAHFKVFVNDSLVADTFAIREKRLYEIPWRGRLDKIDSLMVQFDNDKFDESGDRNLYIKEIIIDHVTHIPFQYNSVYDIGALDGKRRVNNNFSSHAELARNSLLSLGIDSSLVLAIPGKEVRLNRTLSSALAFRDWLKTSDIKVEGINIVTMGTHARRTLMTYNKILNRSYRIGIISLPDYKESRSGKYRIFKTIRESFGLVYYWFLLLPYHG